MDKMKTRIVRIVENDVDGCGSFADAYFLVTGNEDKMTFDTAFYDKINDVIAKTKEEYDGEWDTDTIIDAIIDYMTKSLNFSCQLTNIETIDF